jgi:hypothetical protein
VKSRPFLITPEQLYVELEQLLTRLGVKIRLDSMDEELTSKGGLCMVKGKAVLIINRTLDLNEKNNLIIQSLQILDTEGIYMKPFIRQVIEARRHNAAKKDNGYRS